MHTHSSAYIELIAFALPYKVVVYIILTNGSIWDCGHHHPPKSAPQVVPVMITTTCFISPSCMRLAIQ